MKKKTLILIWLVMSLGCITHEMRAQQADSVVLDSLTQLIDTVRNDSIRSLAINEWGWRSRNTFSNSADWVKTLSPLYLTYLDSAVMYYEEKRDTANLLYSLAHIATYNIQVPDSSENKALHRYNYIRGLQGFDVITSYMLADSSGEYWYHRVHTQLLILEDSSKELTFDQILKPEYQRQFVGNFTYPTTFKKHPKGRVFWVKLKLNSADSRDDDYTFLIGRNESSWREIDVFIQDSLNRYSQYKSGNDIPVEEKMIPDWRNKIEVFVPKGSSRFVYLRLAKPARIQTPYFIQLSQTNSKKIMEKEMMTWQINGVFFGMVFIQALFFIFLFISTRIRYYFYYNVFLAGLALIMIITNYLKLFAPAWIEFTEIFNTIVATFMALGLIYFVYYFLEVDKFSKYWKYFLWISSIVLICLAGLVVWSNFTSVDDFFLYGPGSPIQDAVRNVMVFGVIALIAMVYWSISAYRGGQKSAKYLLMGMGVMLVGVGVPMIAAILKSDLLSFEQAIMSCQVSVIILLAFFAFALGQQRNELEEEKKKALEEQLILQEKINTASAKFVPFDFIKSLGKENILDVKLGDATEREVTVFFSDIRGYTSLVENMSPAQNFRFINDFHKTIGPSISLHQGFVNQYLGDGIMAIFLQSQDHALQAAIDIQRKLQTYEPKIIGDEDIKIRLGMGLHAGPLMMGIIGDESRTDAASISDTVNTASRMEGLTKHYGASILLSGQVRERLENKEDYALRYLGKVQVKGKQNSVEVYECLDGKPESERTLLIPYLKEFQAGVEAYFAQDFKLSQQIFEEICARNGRDKAAALYLDKSIQYLQQGVSAEWDGVLLMKEK